MRRGAEAVVGGKGGMIITERWLAMDGMKMRFEWFGIFWTTRERRELACKLR